MAETAASSPIRPLTMMKGRSTNPLRLSNRSAANELKPGIEWSEMMRSQLPPSSAASMAAGVSTRSQTGSYPPLRNILTRSRASSSESSTSKTLSGIPIQAQAPRRPKPMFLGAYSRQMPDRSSAATTIRAISITSVLFYCYPGAGATRRQKAKLLKITHLGDASAFPAELSWQDPDTGKPQGWYGRRENATRPQPRQRAGSGFRRPGRSLGWYDERSGRANVVRDRAPQRARGACWPYAFRGSARLAAIQRPFPEGALSRPAGALVPDSLDRDPRSIFPCQRRTKPHYYRPLHVHLVAHPGADTSDPRLLRRLQGEPGRRVPLPVHRGSDRRPAARGLRHSRPNKYSDMPRRYTRVRERIRTRRPFGDGPGAR